MERFLKFLKLLIVPIILLFSADMLLASVFPEGSQRAGLQDSYDEFLVEKSLKNEGISLQCESTGSRLWSDWGFRNSSGGDTAQRVTEIRDWCNSLIVVLKIDPSNFDQHCGWQQSGRYGNYTYRGNFVYYHDYPGSPQFYFQPLCDGEYSGSGGGY